VPILDDAHFGFRAQDSDRIRDRTEDPLSYERFAADGRIT